MEARGAQHLWLTYGVCTRGKRYQPVSGPYNHLAAYFDGLQSSDGDMEDNRSHFDLRLGLGVSLTAPYRLNYCHHPHEACYSYQTVDLGLHLRPCQISHFHGSRIAAWYHRSLRTHVSTALQASFNRQPKRTQSNSRSSGFAKSNSKSVSKTDDGKGCTASH